MNRRLGLLRGTSLGLARSLTRTVFILFNSGLERERLGLCLQVRRRQHQDKRYLRFQNAQLQPQTYCQVAPNPPHLFSGTLPLHQEMSGDIELAMPRIRDGGSDLR